MNVLAKRLGVVMNKIIIPYQRAFLKGRMLFDGVVVVNEVIDLAKQTMKACHIFKVDFVKAYDSVSLRFMDYMLIRFNFNDK